MKIPRRSALVLLAQLVPSCISTTDPSWGTDEPVPEPVETVVFAPIDAKLEWVRANTCTDAGMTLTASDGTGLSLVSMAAKAVVDGPLAFTELHLTFANPEPRVLEGRFEIQLPPAAAISRFAMQIDERWQEGEVVERKAAQQVYEDFLHRRQDPALLENDAGNVFQARVFPIPAHAEKHLVLSYSQELERTDEPYRLPLCGLPELGVLDVDVTVRRGPAAITSSLGGEAAEIRHLAVRKEKFRPDQDLEVHMDAGGVEGLRHGRLAVARISPVLEAVAPPMDALTIVLDTSASRALDWGGQLERLSALVTELDRQSGGDLRLTVACADQTVETVFEGPASAFGASAIEPIRQRGAFGATDLAGALTLLRARGDLSPRVLLVTDGIATAGDVETSEIATVVRDLRTAGVQRIDALVDGGIQDRDALAAITTAGLPADGVVLDARIDRPTIARKLLLATRSGIGVTVEGAASVWPTRLDGVQPGDQVLVFADLPEGKPMEVKLVGASLADERPKLALAALPLLERAHARARIDALTARKAELEDPAQANAIVEEIVQLSTQARVLSDYTALLVLETEADYERYGLLRRGLSDIITVGSAGLEIMKRGDLRPHAVEPERTRLAERKKSANADKDEEAATRELDGDGRPGDALSNIPSGGPSGGPSDGPSRDFTAVVEASADAGRDGAGYVIGGVPSPMPEPAAPPPQPTASSRPAREPPAEAPRGGEGGGGSGRAERSRIHRRSAADLEASERIHDDSPAQWSEAQREAPPVQKPQIATPWTGDFQRVMEALRRGDPAAARREATAWHERSPGDALALLALGEVEEAAQQPGRAARVYGSVIDLFPARADLRRMAGERLERLGAIGLPLAIDTYEKAAEQRPDHPSSHRLYAFALAKAGRVLEAFDVLHAALGKNYPHDRLSRTSTALREDLGVLAQVIVSRGLADPKVIEKRLSERGVFPEQQPSLRFVLVWETDANDVDFHIYDGQGNHAFYGQRNLASGGVLFDDVTTGYGPEQFAIEGPSRAFPYTLQAHYYSRGPMGYGMGSLQVMEHDGKGELRFRDQPFVIMVDSAYVDLGTVERSLFEVTPTKR